MFHSGLSASALLPSLPTCGGRWRPLGRRGRPSQIQKAVFGKLLTEECLVGVWAYSAITVQHELLVKQWLNYTIDHPTTGLIWIDDMEDEVMIDLTNMPKIPEMAMEAEEIQKTRDPDVSYDAYAGAGLQLDCFDEVMSDPYMNWGNLQHVIDDSFPLLTFQRVQVEVTRILGREDLKRRVGAIHSSSESSRLWARRCAFLWKQWYFSPLPSQV